MKPFLYLYRIYIELNAQIKRSKFKKMKNYNNISTMERRREERMPSGTGMLESLFSLN